MSWADPYWHRRPRCPRDFPRAFPPDAEQIQQDIATALAARPELVELDLLARQVQVELAQAQNMLLPKLDATVLASKDVGGWADEKGDQNTVGTRSGAPGRDSASAARSTRKGRGGAGKAGTNPRETTVHRRQDHRRSPGRGFRSSRRPLLESNAHKRISDLSRETLELGRQSFNAGDIDLIALNIYEQAVTDAQLLLISAQVDFFVAEADYRAALARDYDSLTLQD